MSTTRIPAQATAVDADPFSQAARMAAVAQKIAIEKNRKDAGLEQESTLSREELPDLFAYFVSLGVMSADQARALAAAIASGGLSTLPDLPSQGHEFFYDAFLAFLAQRDSGGADIPEGAQADTVEAIVAAVEWIIDHAPVIVAAAEAIAEAASSFWHWLTD